MSEARLDQRFPGSDAAWMLAALLPGALTLYLGFRAGGFYPGATALAAAEMSLVVALWFAFARRPLEGLSAPLVLALVGLGGLAAWALLSSEWSGSVARTLPEYSRTLLYLMTLLLFGILPFSTQRIRWMLYGMAAAIVVICAAAVIARTLPSLILDPTLFEEDRLAYPLTYWNTLGLLAGVGIVLCGHLACSIRDPWPARVLGAAAVPLLTLTLFYTLSRAATWATIGAVVVYVLVGRPRGLLAGAVATLPTTLAILVVANPADALTQGVPTDPAAIEAGKHVALVLCVCMGGAALLRASLLPFDRWVGAWRLTHAARRPVLGGAVVAGIVLLLSAGIALNVPAAVEAKYGELTNPDDGYVGGGSSRLLDASTNGRQKHWAVALEAFRRDRLQGSGAGTYSLAWARERQSGLHVEDAHSLYVEMLGELGLVGFALLVVAISLILGAFAYCARGPDRAMFAALLAVGLGWAVASGVDWDWEMPAVTVWLFAFGGAALARAPGGVRQIGIGTTAIRILGVVACVALAVLPARLAISQSRLDSAVDSLSSGDCRQAREDSRSALAAVDQRPTPYSVIAYCEMAEQRYGRAAVTMRRAVRRDPGSWKLQYNLAVARAGAGLDPRPAARRAVRLNPHSGLASRAVDELRGSGPVAWRTGVRRVAAIAPTAAGP